MTARENESRATSWFFEACFWTTLAGLFFLQSYFTARGLHRLWYEELAESIRNPFWLEQRSVYDGTSSNVGWYGLVLATNKLFGFSVYGGKHVRLALAALELIFLGALLRRWLGVKRGLIPLVAVGLSPSLLYFNQLATSYGADFQLAPLLVWLVVKCGDSRRGPRWAFFVFNVLAGLSTMFACLVFPSFIAYLPPLALLYDKLAAPIDRKAVTAALLGFLAPFLGFLAYLRKPLIFLCDPHDGGAGVFRGGGGHLTLKASVMFRALAGVFGDLFGRGQSYYFSITGGEFSGAAGALAFAGVSALLLRAYLKKKKTRFPLLLSLLLCSLAIGLPMLSRTLPGLRRSTGFLAGFYAALACLWASWPGGRAPGFSARLVRWATPLVSLLLIAHHVSVLGDNLDTISGSWATIYDPWFYDSGPPDESVKRWSLEVVAPGRPLDCRKLAFCRYSEIYAAVASYLESARPGRLPVHAILPEDGATIDLNIGLWESYQFRH